MIRRWSSLVLTASLALAGSVLGATSQAAVAAPAAAADASTAVCPGDDVLLSARVQQLAHAFAEGLGDRGRSKLINSKRLHQHALAPCAGTVRVTFTLKNGFVIGAADFALTRQEERSFRIPLPGAKKLRKQKHPVVRVAVEMHDPAGDVLTAGARKKL